MHFTNIYLPRIFTIFFVEVHNVHWYFYSLLVIRNIVTYDIQWLVFSVALFFCKRLLIWDPSLFSFMKIISFTPAHIPNAFTGGAFHHFLQRQQPVDHQACLVTLMNCHDWQWLTILELHFSGCTHQWAHTACTSYWVADLICLLHMHRLLGVKKNWVWSLEKLNLENISK